MFGANLTITNASILLLYLAILAYSPYLTIAAGFLGITAIFFGQNTTETVSAYKIFSILLVIFCIGLLNLRIEINYQYLLLTATFFLLIFISKTQFTDTKNIFFLALIASFFYRFDDYSQLFSVWLAFGDNATGILTNAQFSDSGIFSLNRLALALVFMVIMSVMLKTSFYQKVLMFSSAYFIAGIIGSRALYFVLALSIIYYFYAFFRGNENRGNLILFFTSILLAIILYYVIVAFSSGVRSNTLGLSLDCINTTTEFLLGNPICAQNTISRDFDSLYLVLFAFYGFLGSVLFLLGIIFFCIGCKLKNIIDPIFILIIFFLVHSLDISYTNPEFFIPFIIAQFLSNNSYKENEV